MSEVPLYIALAPATSEPQRIDTPDGFRIDTPGVLPPPARRRQQVLKCRDSVRGRVKCRVLKVGHLRRDKWTALSGPLHLLSSQFRSLVKRRVGREVRGSNLDGERHMVPGAFSRDMMRKVA